MKTKGLSKLAVLGLILLSFTSCKEEEFYEKEFIDTLSEQYERENIPDDVAEAIWDEEDNSSFDDGSSVYNDDGIVITNPPSNEDGTVADGGSNTPGTDDGSANNDSGSSSNDDGTVTDGGSNTPGTDDGSTNNDDGSSSNDDGTVADGGSNTPGTDDGSANNDSGSSSNDDGTVTDGGSNTPGTDDGSTDDDSSTDPDYNNPGDDTPPAVVLNEAADTFQVQSSGNKLDIVWVIDNSGSMGDEQKALGENFDAFIKEFVNKDIDFQMAVTTTDTRRNNAGKAYKNSMKLLNSENLKNNKPKFMKDFANLVKVGVDGYGYEKGIKASEKFAHRYSNNWIRPDAYLTIVYVSDEEDQSEKTVDGHLKQIQKKKANKSLVKAFSIVDMVPTVRRGAIIRGYKRYKEISEKTGGEVASIKSDFHETLLKMGEQIANLAQQYPLSGIPYSADSIEILVNGAVNTDWTYDAESNSIKFDEQSAPDAGSEISVTYDVEDKN